MLGLLDHGHTRSSSTVHGRASVRLVFPVSPHSRAGSPNSAAVFRWPIRVLVVPDLVVARPVHGERLCLGLFWYLIFVSPCALFLLSTLAGILLHAAHVFFPTPIFIHNETPHDLFCSSRPQQYPLIIVTLYQFLVSDDRLRRLPASLRPHPLISVV